MQLTDPLLAVPGQPLRAEQCFQILKHLRLPRRHLVRVHLVVGGDLRDSLLTPDRLQGYLRLELR